jgi:hypothetical protein
MTNYILIILIIISIPSYTIIKRIKASLFLTGLKHILPLNKLVITHYRNGFIHFKLRHYTHYARLRYLIENLGRFTLPII